MYLAVSENVASINVRNLTGINDDALVCVSPPFRTLNCTVLLFILRRWLIVDGLQ